MTHQQSGSNVEYTWRLGNHIAEREATRDRSEAEERLAEILVENPGIQVGLVARNVTEWADVR